MTVNLSIQKAISLVTRNISYHILIGFGTLINTEGLI